MTNSPVQLPTAVIASHVDTTALVVRSLVLYSIAEHQAGYASVVRVTANGNTFSVADDGRGHAIDRTIDGTPYLPLIYEQIRYPFSSSIVAAVQLQGIGISLINALCSRLEVAVRKPNAVLFLTYLNGHLYSRERVEENSVNTGNTIQGIIHPALAAPEVDQGQLRNWLKSIQSALPLLCIFFNGVVLVADPASDV